MKSRSRNFKIYILLLALLAAVLFSSFGNSVNIKDRILVHALGIDASDNGGYIVSMQVFKPTGAGSDVPVDISQSNIQVVKSEGKTISEALERSQEKIGRQIFLGHLQFICFGKDIDFSNPEELLSFTLKDKNIYLGVKLCMSETTAEDLINAQITRGTMSAESIAKIIEMNVENSTTIDCELIDLLSTVETPQYIAMPVLTVKKAEESEQAGGQSQDGAGQSSEKEPEIEINSTALIKEGKVLESSLSIDEAIGASWLSRQAKESRIVITHGGELMTVKITCDSSRVSLENQNGRLIYNAEITVLADVSKDVTTRSESEEIAAEVTEEFSKYFYAAEQKALYENHADIFGIWRLLRHSYPKSYLEYENRLDEIYDATDFSVRLNVRVE